MSGSCVRVVRYTNLAKEMNGGKMIKYIFKVSEHFRQSETYILRWGKA